MHPIIRYFGTSITLTILSIIVAGIAFGPSAALTTVILIAIEIAFSFDNAVINAKILARLSKLWQQLFLTIGMVVAIVGMRFVFPILIVMVTADLSWGTVIDDALHHPKVYGEHLEEAHTAISSFGGAFLLTLTLYFFFDEHRRIVWLERIERPLQRIKSGIWLPPLLVSVLVVFLALLANGAERSTILRAGLAGAISYAAIHLFIEALGKISGNENAEQSSTNKKAAMYTGWSAFLAFMYLQILDASFSFDGVLGAFAITDKIVLIALGLGVGAIWVRSLTVYMVRKGTLDAYKYLEHGAHYAILTLSLALLAAIYIEIPDAITGAVGLGIIWASYMASRQAINDRKTKKHPQA